MSKEKATPSVDAQVAPTPATNATPEGPSTAELQAMLAAMAQQLADLQAKQSKVHTHEPFKPREPVTRKLDDGTIRVDL